MEENERLLRELEEKIQEYCDEAFPFQERQAPIPMNTDELTRVLSLSALYSGEEASEESFQTIFEFLDKAFLQYAQALALIHGDMAFHLGAGECVLTSRGAQLLRERGLDPTDDPATEAMLELGVTVPEVEKQFNGLIESVSKEFRRPAPINFDKED